MDRPREASAGPTSEPWRLAHRAPALAAKRAPDVGAVGSGVGAADARVSTADPKVWAADAGVWAVDSDVQLGSIRLAMGLARGAGLAIIRGPGSGEAIERERATFEGVVRSAGAAALVLVLCRVALWASFCFLAARHARRTRTGAFSNTVSRSLLP